MLLRVPLIILIGFFTINAKAEQQTTTEISSEDNNSSQSNVTTSKESVDHRNSYPRNTTTPVSKNVNILIYTSESSHEKTRRSDSVVDIPTNSDLKQETDSDKDIDEKSKDSDLLDSNISSIVTTKSSNLKTDDTISFRRLNLTDSKIKDSNLNDTYNNSQHANTTELEIKDESYNDSEYSKSLSDHHLQPNTDESQVLSRSHTDNVYKLYNNKENHNETEAKISKNSDNHNTNTKASKESIVNDANDSTNDKDTTKLSNPHLEPNNEISQVFRRSYTDNVHEVYDNKEHHNETTAKISRNANNHNTNTKTSKESIVNDVNDSSNEKDTTKLSNPRLEPNTEIISQVFRSSNIDDNEDNRNKTESKISSKDDNHNTNTKSSKEFIVNYVNDSTNKKDTTKLSNPRLEPNTEIYQVFRRSDTDDNEENRNETEAKISRNAENHNTNTKPSKNSIVYYFDVNDGTNKKDTTKLSNPPIEPNTEISQVLSRSHTDNVYELYDNKENHNETEAKISKNADNHNTNTKGSKEAIVNDVNDGTNKIYTTNLSNPRLEPNNETSQVLRSSHTDNVHEPCDDEENHNETESKISRNANNHNTNTKASKEFIVNDVNDGTNKKYTTKLSNPLLEPNTEISQVFRRSNTDNVHEPCDDEENHNDIESKISINADNHNTKTKASIESIVNDVNDGTKEKDTTLRDVDHDNKQIDDTKSRLLNITEIYSEESIEHNKGALSAAFTRRSFNYYDDNENFIETNATTTDEPISTEYHITTEHPTTTEQHNNNYKLLRRHGFTRPNLDYVYGLSKESTAKSAEPNEENEYPFDLTQINFNQRNKTNDFTIRDTVKPIEEANNTEDLGTALLRSGRPDGGYIAEPYDEEPNLIKPSMVLNTCCQARPSSPYYGTLNSFIVHPIYGKIPLNLLGKSIEINTKPLQNGNTLRHHYLFPNIKIPLLQRPYENYGNPEALNVFHNHANPGKYEDHGNNIAYQEKHGIVFAYKKNPLTSHENQFSNHELPLAYHKNPFTTYENPHQNYGNLRSYDPSYAKHENPPTNNKKPQSNYGNPHNSYDPLTYLENPIANHENLHVRHDPFPNYEIPSTIHGNNNAKYLANQPDYDASYNHFLRNERHRKRDDIIDDNFYPRAVGTRDSHHQAIHENLPTNHENPNLTYENPLRNHGPHTKHENPVAEQLITRRVYPLADNQNENNTIHGQFSKHDEDPFYNNFRHHKTSLLSSEEIDDHPVNRTGDVDHQATGTDNPVPSSQANVTRNPYRKASQKFPFRKFFL